VAWLQQVLKIAKIQRPPAGGVPPSHGVGVWQNAAGSKEEPSMNGAAVIAEILRREGTEFLSCYPRNPLIEACAALDIRPILCRQERVGVGLADGYTRIKCGKRMA
jgi:hypothetical protein